MRELIEITNATPIEIVLGVDQEGKTTARKLYEFLGLDKSNYSKWYTRNILDNQFATIGEDYVVFVPYDENPLGGRPTQDFKLTASFAKKLAMGTHNEKGEQAKEYFLKIEERLKQKSSANIDISQLSPDLQMFNQIFNSLAIQQIKQKEIENQVKKTNEKVEGIKDILQISPSKDWRKWTNEIVSKICYKLNDYKLPKDEIYKALEARAKCNLKRRLDNLIDRLEKFGLSNSKLNKLNYLDVIAEENKLIEIYVAIVKEMAIKYGLV